jgi:drug/metabolite transporter (DMT)-like permease
MHNIIRYVAADLHPFQIAFLRNLFGVLVFVPWFLAVGFGTLKTDRIGMHVARGAVNSLSMLTWFTALSLIPVADATSLALVGPVFVTLGAILVFRERVDAHRWTGIGVALLGALIIIRPGFQPVGLATLLILVATLSVSISKLMAKSLATTDGTATVVAYLTLLMMGFTVVPAMFVWQRPPFEHLALLALVGTFGTVGHLLFIKAYKLTDVSLVEPVMFMRMIWAALIGLILFAEFPDVWTWLGGAVIVAGNTYMARREVTRAQHTAETLP